MNLTQIFSWNPPKEIEKLQNDDIALEIADELSSIIEESYSDYETCVSTISEHLSQLVKKDEDLALAILNILRERYSEINQKFLFEINS